MEWNIWFEAALSKIRPEKPASANLQGDIPEGNNGLGLLLLGLTGDEVLRQTPTKPSKPRPFLLSGGTVQADILKEDQAQNTYIFSTEFSFEVDGRYAAIFYRPQCAKFLFCFHQRLSLPKPGPINPISQLAFYFVERLYLHWILFIERHAHRWFCAQLVFLFSNGVDPEYAVIGRVARRIWAKAIKINTVAMTVPKS